MPLTIRDLRLVVALDEGGSLAAAASRLRVSSSAVGRQLAGLEDRLRLPLFRRVGRRLVAEPATELLLPHARQVLRGLYELEIDAGIAARPRREWVRLSAPWPLPRGALGCVFGTLHRWFASPLLGFTQRSQGELEAELLDARLDLALSLQVPRSPAIVSREVSDVEHVGIARGGHRWAQAESVRVEDLAGELLLAGDPLPEARLLLPDAELPCEVQPTGSLALTLDLVAAGKGVALVPHWLPISESHEQSLVARHFAGPSPRARCWLLGRPDLPEALVATLAPALAETMRSRHAGPTE